MVVPLCEGTGVRCFLTNSTRSSKLSLTSVLDIRLCCLTFQLQSYIKRLFTAFRSPLGLLHLLSFQQLATPGWPQKLWQCSIFTPCQISVLRVLFKKHASRKSLQAKCSCSDASFHRLTWITGSNLCCCAVKSFNSFRSRLLRIHSPISLAFKSKHIFLWSLQLCLTPSALSDMSTYEVIPEITDCSYTLSHAGYLSPGLTSWTTRVLIVLVQTDRTTGEKLVMKYLPSLPHSKSTLLSIAYIDCE